MQRVSTENDEHHFASVQSRHLVEQHYGDIRYTNKTKFGGVDHVITTELQSESDNLNNQQLNKQELQEIEHHYDLREKEDLLMRNKI